MKSNQADSLPYLTIRPDAAATWPDVLFPTVLLAAALAAIPVDFSLGHWAVQGGCPGFFRELFEAAEPFGNGNGVIYVVFAVLALDSLRRRVALRILVTAYGAGLAADAVKLLVERTRPYAFAFEGTIRDSFVGILPLTGAGSEGQSFPSAHTATAVGLAAALTWRYPQGRIFFFAMAALVAAQRITGGAHFLSDTLCGAAVACVVATFTLRHGRLAGWLDRYESKTDVATDRPMPKKLAA